MSVRYRFPRVRFRKQWKKKETKGLVGGPQPVTLIILALAVRARLMFQATVHRTMNSTRPAFLLLFPAFLALSLVVLSVVRLCFGLFFFCFLF